MDRSVFATTGLRPFRSLLSSRSVHALLLVAALGTFSACGSSSGSSNGSGENPEPGPDPTPVNRAPVAEASAPAEVIVGRAVSLDGTASSDPDGDLVSFFWTLEVPAGSDATLDDPALARPVFTADREGDYGVTLVVSDGELESETVELSVRATRDNSAPDADAGEDQSILLGDPVTIDGGASSDPEGDALSFEWAFRSTPLDSAVSLRGETGPVVSFTPDLIGRYVVRLVVRDGNAASAEDRVTITVEDGNQAPIADAGPDRTVVVDDPAPLDGRSSFDPEGGALGYQWTLLSAPEGSLANLQRPRADIAGIFPDVPGDYVVRLVVNDGARESEPDDVILTAVARQVVEAPPAPPAPPEEPDACAPEPGLIFCDALAGSTSSSRRDGGRFVEGGWQSPGQLVWDLGRTLTQGRFEATLENWDPSSGSPQHRNEKQHILNMYESAHVSAHSANEEGTGFFNVRTGRPYNELFKFLSSISGFGDGREESRLTPPGGGRIDPSVPHRIAVDWFRGGEISVYLDGVLLRTHRHPRDLRFRYVAIGTDSSGSNYGPQHDVIFRDIKVYAPGG